MWKYEAIKEYDTISLHDCRINHISENNGSIVFSFLDGYWIVETNSQNPFHKTLGTDDSAKLTFTDSSCNKVVLQNEAIIWDDFVCNINSGDWEFECIEEIYKANQCIYNGCIWFDREPYHQDLSLTLTFSNIVV